jgi:hypothetical protein
MKLVFLGNISSVDEPVLRKLCRIVVESVKETDNLPIRIKFYELYEEFCYVVATIMEEELTKAGFRTSTSLVLEEMSPRGADDRLVTNRLDSRLFSLLTSAEKDVVIDACFYLSSAPLGLISSNTKEVLVRNPALVSSSSIIVATT